MRDKTCVGTGILIGIILLMLIAISGWFFSPDLTEAESDAVGLSADITTSITCSSEPGQTGFETLTVNAVFTATSTATTTMSCNVPTGCTLNVKDAGDGNPGLYNSVSSDLIDSATETLTQGTEGYGIQAATTTAGTGAELLIDPVYKKTGDDVGGFLTTNQTLTSSAAPISGKLTIVTYKATISGINKSGNYVDTVTFECLTN